MPVSAKQVERLTRRVGAERVAERDASVAAYQALPLAEKFAAPAAQAPTQLTGLTDRRHRQLAEKGYFRPPARGEYGEDAIPGLFKYFLEQLRKKNEALAKEQLELTRAKREKVQEELKVLRDEYVKKSEIGPALRNLSLHQRAALQFKLENQLAPGLTGKKPAEVLEEVRRAVDDICRVFEEGTRTWMNAAP